MTLKLALVLSLSACAIETEGDEPELAETESALTGWFLPFEAAGATGVSPTPPTRTQVVDGILGWSGDWNEYPLVGWVQSTVFRTSTLSGSKTGIADLAWSTFSLPADGTYRLSTTDSPIRIDGFTKVKGNGNYFTSVDAKAESILYIFVSLDGVVKYQTSKVLGRDETKSESRTKHFDVVAHLPDGFTFTGTAGQDVSLLVRVQSKVWSNTDGSAEVGIREFGIPAVNSHDLVVVQE